jgi:hypothetical protein
MVTRFVELECLLTRISLCETQYNLTGVVDMIYGYLNRHKLNKLEELKIGWCFAM